MWCVCCNGFCDCMLYCVGGMKNKPTIAIPPEGCESYLTAGKKYQMTRIIDTGFNVIDDTGVRIFCSYTESAHLNGKDWILK